MTPPRDKPGPGRYPDSFILLTGGAGRRLGGADKAALRVGKSTLLERALVAVQGRPVVVVGPRPDVDAGVIVTREDPPDGGPAAGVAAGAAALVAALSNPQVRQLVAVQAVDQAGVTPGTWRRLAAAAATSDGGAVLIGGGRRQYGVGVFPLTLLGQACAAQPTWHGRPLRALLDPIVAVEVDALGAEARDIDTLEDLSWWRAQAEAWPAAAETAHRAGDEGEPR